MRMPKAQEQVVDSDAIKSCSCAGTCEAMQRELALLRKVRDEADERIHRLQWDLSNACVACADS
jgi:hypothetical protein